MFDRFIGWRKASNCKKLIKRFRCRLNIVKMKRYAVAKQLKEDIFQLWKNGYQQIAFSRVDQLCMDENMLSVYEFLDKFAEFILLNLSYIRKYKDLPKDVNEAISTLIFASARFSDLSELMRIRKLFRGRYGHKYITIAVELHPGNRVNQQVKEKLTSQSVSEDAKNILLNEVVRDCFYNPEIFQNEYRPNFQVQHKKDTKLYEQQKPLALEYNPNFELQSQKVIKLYEDEEQDNFAFHKSSSPCSSSSSSIELQSFPSIVETPKREKGLNLALSSTPYDHEAGAIEIRKIEDEVVGNFDSSSENSTYYSQDLSVVYLDDVQEFKSCNKQGTNYEDYHDQDQRFFIFSFSSFDDFDLGKKRPRSRSVSREKQVIDDIQSEIYDYNYRPSNWNKCQKKVQFEERQLNCLVDHGNQTDEKSEQREIVLVKDYMGSSSLLARECGALAPYTTTTTPERRDMEMQITEVSKVNSASPKYVHPKLPDYDEITVKFKALKEVHQQNKCMRS